LYIFFWVFPRRQIVVGRRFGTLYQFHLQRLVVQYCTHSLWRWNWYRVPKRRPTTIWRRGNTQRKIYNVGEYCIFPCKWIKVEDVTPLQHDSMIQKMFSLLFRIYRFHFSSESTLSAYCSFHDCCKYFRH